MPTTGLGAGNESSPPIFALRVLGPLDPKETYASRSFLQEDESALVIRSPAGNE